MTWLLSEACQLIAVAVSVRHSFKILSKLSKHCSRTNEQLASNILKFWVLFAFVRIFEGYVEYFIKW